MTDPQLSTSFQFFVCSRRFKFAVLLCGGSLLVSLLVGLFLWHVRTQNARGTQELGDLDHEGFESTSAVGSEMRKSSELRSPLSTKQMTVEPLLSANLLATLIVTQRKLCLFEVSTAEVEKSRVDYEEEHVYGAQLLLFPNLTHSGVPTHPLNFQRLVRNIGIDSDCHVVLYDRGQQIWSTYAFWIFNLFGHEKTSLLNGGLAEWRARARDQPDLYKLETGVESFPERLGSFHASWVPQYVTTFDDVVSNFQSHEFDIVDAQTEEEYMGTAKGAAFGHIRSAINIPIDEIYDWQNNTWPSNQHHRSLLRKKQVTTGGSIIVYDGTSLRSSMIWFALRRLGIRASIYFGSWSEFAFRAPDSLKVAPNHQLND